MLLFEAMLEAFWVGGLGEKTANEFLADTWDIGDMCFFFGVGRTGGVLLLNMKVSLASALWHS